MMDELWGSLRETVEPGIVLWSHGGGSSIVVTGKDGPVGPESFCCSVQTGSMSPLLRKYRGRFTTNIKINV